MGRLFVIHIRATWSVDAGDKRQLPREVWEVVRWVLVRLLPLSSHFWHSAPWQAAHTLEWGVVRVSHADNFHLEEKEPTLTFGRLEQPSHFQTQSHVVTRLCIEEPTQNQ